MGKFIPSPRIVIAQDKSGEYEVMLISRDSSEIRRKHTQLSMSKEYLGVWTYEVPRKRGLNHAAIAQFEAGVSEVEPVKEEEEQPKPQKRRGRKPKTQE